VPLAVLGSSRHGPIDRAGVYYAIASAYAASVVLFYVSARYRMPLVPLRPLRRRRVGVADDVPAHRGCPKIAAAAAQSRSHHCDHLPLLSADLMRATTETNLGVALQTDGRLQEAENHYRRALLFSRLRARTREPGDGPVALHRPDEAIESYKRAIELNRETSISM
jgi:tetratricopeptide (TPR) repeat protein